MTIVKAGAVTAALTLAAAGAALLPLASETASAQPASPATPLVVAMTGTDTGNCHLRPCKTLGYALTQAHAHDSIVMEPGLYPESNNANIVPARLTGLTITSAGGGARAVIDAMGDSNGIRVEASGVSVRGLTVENANLEGILVEPPKRTWPSTPTSPPANIDDVTVTGNVVAFNDRAYNPKLPALSACPRSLTDADDCGEGIHLLGVSWSNVTHNVVTNNVGGILVSDGGFGIAVGPAAHNFIGFNVSTDNAFDCGVTLPGHDPFGVATNGPNAGSPQPSVAGVYDNTVMFNISSDNGAAGLLDAAPYPGAASYDNFFGFNTVSGNGNGGFTLHSHAPLQDTSGIVVVGNRFGPNNLAGDPDTGVDSSTGIMLLSVAIPTSIVVTGNTVTDDVNGIASNDKITVIGHNTFTDVNHPSFTYTPPAA